MDKKLQSEIDREIDEYENVLQDELDYLLTNKSNESENVLINENNGNEIKSITMEEITGQSETDREIEDFKNVFEDGLDELLINALIEFEEKNKKEDKKEEFIDELKKENKKRKENENNDKKIKKKILINNNQPTYLYNLT
ncbi:hypothetical protein RF55_18786 [Lasius niger]|uniref:Uncharacterized protein n=1 Tax=Lasius niger TaxID=67767 RepID=A0A0J7K0T1_LASNI|nr:hypothetical protein RF55_18786 [Lasius niger]